MPFWFQYLKKGCTRYFTNSRSEKTLSSNQKSADHIAKGSLKDILLDDVGDFQVLDDALNRIGLSQADRWDIYKTVAAVLHLGNIEFEDDSDDRRGGCQVAQNKGNSLNIAAKLLNIDPMDLRQALESRVMQSTRGGMKGTVIMWVFLENFEGLCTLKLLIWTFVITFFADHSDFTYFGAEQSALVYAIVHVLIDHDGRYKFYP